MITETDVPADAHSPEDTYKLAINVTPDPVDAGGKLTIRARAATVAGVDLRGESFHFFDAEDNPIGEAVFTLYDGRVNECEPLTLVAPLETGKHRWVVALPEVGTRRRDIENAGSEDDAPGPSQPEAETAYRASAEFAFDVKAQKTTLLVWDVPTAIVPGQRFSFKVGAKTSGATPLTGQRITILNQRDEIVASTVLSGTLAPKTAATFMAEIALDAAESEGLHKWRAEIEGSEAVPAQESAQTSFSVRFVPTPECAVTITTTEINGTTPIAGALVVMHPYRATTDENGAARLLVPKGEYKILVSKAKYEAATVTLAVNADMTTHARLEAEQKEDPDAAYM